MNDDGSLEATTIIASASGWSSTKIVIPGPIPEDKKKCPFCGGAMYRVEIDRTDPSQTIIYMCNMCGFRASFYIRSKIYPEP